MNALTTTLSELLSDNLATRPDKVALIDATRTVTYSQLQGEVEQLAAHMTRCGIGRGDRVGVQLQKSIAEVVAMFAAARVGAVVVNVNFQWTVAQLNYVAEDSQARMLVVEARQAKALDGQLPGGVEHVVVRGSAPANEAFISWEQLPPTGSAALSAALSATPVLDTEPAMIIYTSGSTGKPKGVVLSHRNIIAGARSVARYLELSEHDRLISVLPYSFDYGLNQLTTMLLLGGTVVHQPVVMPAEIVKTLVNQKITGFAAVPPLWNQVVRLLNESPVPLPDLKRVTNSGGKIPKNVLALMPKVFPGVDIYLMYGLTEAFRSTYLHPSKFAAKAGSMGQAIPGAETYIIRHGEGIAGPGEQGELVHRGPLISLGYWGNPKATQEKIRPCPELAPLIGDEPVVYSGDIVSIDDDGDYWFVGRNDSMIKTSGFRLSPDEVEDLVAQSGLVGDVVAFGVDDDSLGQVVHVAVSPLPTYDEALLERHCRQVMPHYMVPKKFHPWQEPMPRTGSGKLAKPEVIRISKGNA